MPLNLIAVIGGACAGASYLAMLGCNVLFATALARREPPYAPSDFARAILYLVLFLAMLGGVGAVAYAGAAAVTLWLATHAMLVTKLGLSVMGLAFLGRKLADELGETSAATHPRFTIAMAITSVTTAWLFELGRFVAVGGGLVLLWEFV